MVDKITECIECNFTGCEELAIALNKVKYLQEENKELKEYYEQQLKVALDKFNDLKQRTDKEYMEYSKELGLCRKKLEKVKDFCKQILNDEMAMSGEHLTADDILQIISSK